MKTLIKYHHYYRLIALMAIVFLLKLSASAQSNWCNADFKSSYTTILCPAGTDCKLLEQVVYTFRATDTTHCEYKWSFSDGTTATGETVTKSYYQNGDYRVKLEVFSHQKPCKGDEPALMVACSNSSVQEIKINQLKYPSATCDAGFTYTKNVHICPTGALCILPDRVEFAFVANKKDQCEYEWNFGDGTKASGSTASHYYTTNGNYKVTLTVKYSPDCKKDSLNSSKCTEVLYLKVNELYRNPEVCSIYLSHKTNGKTIKFYEENAPLRPIPADIQKYYYWNFGDGTDTVIDTKPEIIHTYAKTGTYKVSMQMVAYQIYKSEAVCLGEREIFNQKLMIPCYYQEVCSNYYETEIKLSEDSSMQNIPDCGRFIDVNVEGNLLHAFDQTVEIALFPGYFTNDYYMWDFGDGSFTGFTRGLSEVKHRYADTSKSYTLEMTMGRYKVLDKMPIETKCTYSYPLCDVPENLELLCVSKFSKTIKFSEFNTGSTTALVHHSENSSETQISISNVNEPLQFVLYNQSGAEVKRMPISTDGSYTISTQDLVSGLYLYSIQSSNKVVKKDKLLLIK